MSGPLLPAPWRRLLLLCGLSLLLHAAALAWLGWQLLASRPPIPMPPPLAVRLQPLPTPLPNPLPAAPASTAAASVAGLPAPAATRPDAAAPAAAGVVATAATAAAPETATEPAAVPRARRYRVSLPPSATMALAVQHEDAGGRRWLGSGELAWQLGPDGYRVALSAGSPISAAPPGLRMLSSQGQLDDAGMAPLRGTQSGDGQASDEVLFDREQRRIQFSGSARSFALPAGVQDRASLLMQLAGIARADPAQLEAGIEIVVGDGADASLYRFTLVGQQALSTELGQLDTWHLARLTTPGSRELALEVWLAPVHQWLPVRIRSVDAGGSVTTQQITRISTAR
jgi:hypothetical protein